MTEKEIQQLNYINMFLNAIANSTNEILNHKYNCCVSHQMNFIYWKWTKWGWNRSVKSIFFMQKEMQLNRIHIYKYLSGYLYSRTVRTRHINE